MTDRSTRVADLVRLASAERYELFRRQWGTLLTRLQLGGTLGFVLGDQADLLADYRAAKRIAGRRVAA